MQVNDYDNFNEFNSCDFSQIETQLRRLKNGNDMLQQKIENIQNDIHRQKHIFNDLELKVNSLPQQLHEMQKKLIEDNRINVEELKNFITNEIRTRIPATNAVDDKIVLITEIKEILRDHNHILHEIKKKQINSETILKVLNVLLNDTIVDELHAVQKTITTSILTEVINNHKNIQNLSKEINLNNHTEILKSIILDKLAIMPQLHEKLNNIESNTISKSQQLKFYHNAEQYFHKTGKNCL